MLRQRKNSSAFSIVELIIVIAVIGILASIAVVSYGAWRDNIAETEVKSNLTSVQAEMENVKNFTNEYPTTPAPGDLFDGEQLRTKDIFTSSSEVTMRYASGSGSSYCIDAESNKRPHVQWFLSSTGGDITLQEGTC